MLHCEYISRSKMEVFALPVVPNSGYICLRDNYLPDYTRGYISLNYLFIMFFCFNFDNASATGPTDIMIHNYLI